MLSRYGLHGYAVMPFISLTVVGIAVRCPKDIISGGMVYEEYFKQSRFILQQFIFEYIYNLGHSRKYIKRMFLANLQKILDKWNCSP